MEEKTMNAKKKSLKKSYPTFNALSNHPFPSLAMHYAVRVAKVIEKPHSLFKAKPEYERMPSKAEHYCIAVGYTLAQTLSICRQLENSVLYFSSFSPTQKMKKAGVTKQSYLLYCIENYIIRTHSMYDRLLRLIDRVYELYNPANRISHELVVGNLHVQHSPIPKKLRALRKVVKKYYHDRNSIIHEHEFLEEDVRRLEGYTIILNSPGSAYEGSNDLKQEIRFLAKKIVRNKTAEFSQINHNSFVILGDIFNDLKIEYQSKREILENIYGEPELAE
jgi:hypothetical protein